jgi:hypothetical protein
MLKSDHTSALSKFFSHICDILEECEAVWITTLLLMLLPLLFMLNLTTATLSFLIIVPLSLVL